MSFMRPGVAIDQLRLVQYYIDSDSNYYIFQENNKYQMYKRGKVFFVKEVLGEIEVLQHDHEYEKLFSPITDKEHLKSIRKEVRAAFMKIMFGNTPSISPNTSIPKTFELVREFEEVCYSLIERLTMELANRTDQVWESEYILKEMEKELKEQGMELFYINIIIDTVKERWRIYQHNKRTNPRFSRNDPFNIPMFVSENSEETK